MALPSCRHSRSLISRALRLNEAAFAAGCDVLLGPHKPGAVLRAIELADEGRGQ